MSKLSKSKARANRRRYAKPSLPRAIGANDNHPSASNDNAAPVSIGGVTLTENQARRFAIATEQLASESMDLRRAGQRTMEALEAETTAKRIAGEVEAGLTERRGLEALRGLEIGASKVEGAVGAPKITRDGLETLLTAGSITRIQHAAGMLYRQEYERIDPEKLLTPPQFDPEKVRSVHGGEGWDQKRREIEERVFGIHCMICGVEPPKGKQRAAMPNLPKGHPAMRAIDALERIAGRGDNVQEISASGSVRARLREDLIFALDACAIVYGLD